MRDASGRILRTAARHSPYASSARTAGVRRKMVVTNQMTLIATNAPNAGHASLASG